MSIIRDPRTKLWIRKKILHPNHWERNLVFALALNRESLREMQIIILSDRLTYLNKKHNHIHKLVSCNFCGTLSSNPFSHKFCEINIENSTYISPSCFFVTICQCTANKVNTKTKWYPSKHFDVDILNRIKKIKVGENPWVSQLVNLSCFTLFPHT